MADDKKPGTKKYLDKFETDEELAKAYEQLEKKLGKQGEELGLTKKETAEYQKALQQYAEAWKEAKPIVEWYQGNQGTLTAYGQWLQAQQNAALQPTAGQAGGAGNRALDLLTADERQALVNESLKAMSERVLAPTLEKLNAEFRKMADEREQRVAGSIAQQQKAFTEVLWRTMQRGLPKEKIDEMRQWHEQALAMADPSKFDPMKMADEWLSTQSRLKQLEDEKKALETEREKYQKDSLGSLSGAGSGAAGGWAKKDDSAPAGRDDRMQRVMNDTQESVGRDAFRDFFAGTQPR